MRRGERLQRLELLRERHMPDGYLLGDKFLYGGHVLHRHLLVRHLCHGRPMWIRGLPAPSEPTHAMLPTSAQDRIDAGVLTTSAIRRTSASRMTLVIMGTTPAAIATNATWTIVAMARPPGTPVLALRISAKTKIPATKRHRATRALLPRTRAVKATRARRDTTTACMTIHALPIGAAQIRATILMSAPLWTSAGLLTYAITTCARERLTCAEAPTGLGVTRTHACQTIERRSCRSCRREDVRRADPCIAAGRTFHGF